MYPNEKKINKMFFNWLLITMLLVFLIIIIGGLTRLTNSGLSITEWELFKGIFPPLNDAAWENYFSLYKEIPQYQLLNFNLSLNEFKIIYYWEYAHRLIARFIGLFFLIPLIYFYFSKKIKFKYIKICFIIFLLIVFQGIIGWYMVKSGLINNVSVSHYRLSVHLSTAIIIISSIFWLLKNIHSNSNKKFFSFSNNNLPFQLLILIILFQIILGAFVSGLDAGQIYQTWPKMGSTFFPDDIAYKTLIEFLNFENHSLVQFYHRTLAYIILLYSLYLIFYVYNKRISYLYKGITILSFFLILQVTLGVFTLVSGLNMYLASMHQVTSVLLIFSALNLYFLRVK